MMLDLESFGSQGLYDKYSKKKTISKIGYW